MTDVERITLRRGTLDDGFATYRVLREAVNDLAARIGADPIPGDAESNYQRIEPLFRHLTETAAEFWLAQDSAENVVAYARSIEHGPFFELTEFFVLPGHQSAGIGRRLLERAFPDDRGELRVIVATTDVRALSRYLKAGMTARTPIVSLIGSPTNASGDSDSWGELVAPSSPALAEIAALDRSIAGFDREPELPWLAETRVAVLFRRDERAAGYAFVGAGGVGPIGAADPADLPRILDEVLRRAAAMGLETVSFEVPMSNGTALRHLLARGLSIDPFLTLLLSNREFGQMDRYVAHSPPFFL
jgi:ribosomal protein S18 acetylase RimI-like enzyme